MAQNVVMPKLGQTVEEASIVKWHKKEGDAVKKGDVLFEIETDKAVLEAESFFDGALLKVLVGEGEMVPVSSTVAYIGKPGEAVPDKLPASPAPKPEPAKEEKAPPAPAEEIRKKVEAKASAVKKQAKPPVAPPAPRPASAVAPEPEKRVFISPRAKMMARECAINPASITGTGPNGRIVTGDIKGYLEDNGYDELRISPAAKNLARREGIDILGVRGTGDAGRIMIRDVERALAERPERMNKMRQTIARRLTESFTGTPHFYVTVSVDMTELMSFRKMLKDQGEAYTVNDFILESVILSLKEFPILNSYTDGQSVSWRGSVDLGVAVSIEGGLVVPVVRNAEELTLSELHDKARDLAGRAREGKLLPDEMTGSSFTVSNMGMLDVDSFNAIINPGEAAILAVGTTRETPVVVEGEIKVRSVMRITLSVDHRIVDGATGAAFANAIKAKLEDIELWRSLT